MNTPGSIPEIIVNTLSGAFAERSMSGSITASVTADSAHGTLVFVNGTSVSLSGVFFPASGALGLAGGGYQLSGFLSNGVISGTMGGPQGQGRFTMHTRGPVGESKPYCGTYITNSDYGWFGAAISGSGAVTGFFVSGSGAGSVAMSGAVSGLNVSATAASGVTLQGTLSPDASGIIGTYVPSTATSGSFAASTTACSSQGASNSAGQWTAAADTGVVGNKFSIHALFTETADVLAGGGVITAGFISGWTGDEFEITAGTFSDLELSFVAQLGSNPDGQGGFYYGSLSFSGNFLSPSAIFGELVFTPPRTATQTFAQQRFPGITLVRF